MRRTPSATPNMANAAPHTRLVADSDFARTGGGMLAHALERRADVRAPVCASCRGAVLDRSAFGGGRAGRSDILEGDRADRLVALRAVSSAGPGRALQPDSLRRREAASRADRERDREAAHAAVE